MYWNEFSSKKSAVDVDNEQIIKWMEDLINKAGNRYGHLGSIGSGNISIHAYRFEDEPGIEFEVCKNYLRIQFEDNDLNGNWKGTVDTILEEYNERHI